MSSDDKPACELVSESKQYGRVVLLKVNYGLTESKTLTVTFESDCKGLFQLVFDSPHAVRIIDEGQVCEFWTDYHQKNGWLWRVKQGGWLDLESTRKQFWLEDICKNTLHEFLIVDDQCVFVLTSFPPKFVAVKADL